MALEKLQEAVFGQALVDLRYCDFKYSDLSPEYSHRVICINRQPLDQLLCGSGYGRDSRQVIVFILAHELSHFVHQLSTLQDRKRGRSLNGAPSEYLYDFKEFLAENLKASEEDLKDDNRMLDLIGKISPLFQEHQSLMHAEVDTYAYLVFERAGLPVPFDHLRRTFDEMSKQDILG